MSRVGILIAFSLASGVSRMTLAHHLSRMCWETP
jgi:hypothetical protein